MIKNTDSEFKKIQINNAIEEFQNIPKNTILAIYTQLIRTTSWYHFDIKFNYMNNIDYRLNHNEKKLVVTYNPKTILRLLNDITVCKDCNHQLIKECIKNDECYFCNDFANYNIYSD